MAVASTVKQRTIPGGKVYINLFDVNGAQKGERYIGLTPGFTITMASDSIQSYSSENGMREMDDETTISVTRTGKLTCRQVSVENLALFLAATPSVQTQAAGNVTGEVHRVYPDRYYQLGASTANPTGVRNVSNVVITGATAGEYTVDAPNGRVYVHANATVDPVAGEDWTFAYDVPAATRDQILTGMTVSTSASLRFEAHPGKGLPRDLFGPNVNFAPSGDWVLKADDPQYVELSWDISFSVGRNGEPALIVDGRPE